MICIISPQKGDLASLVGEEAVIADSDPVSISAEVLKDTFNPIEGGFAIDDPLLMIQLSPESLKVLGLLEMA
jgi:hypothetical protein